MGFSAAVAAVAAAGTAVSAHQGMKAQKRAKGQAIQAEKERNAQRALIAEQEQQAAAQKEATLAAQEGRFKRSRGRRSLLATKVDDENGTIG